MKPRRTTTKKGSDESLPQKKSRATMSFAPLEQGSSKIIRAVRLRQAADKSDALITLLVLSAGVGGGRNDGYVRTMRSNLRAGILPAHSLHYDVQNHYIEGGAIAATGLKSGQHLVSVRHDGVRATQLI